MCTERSRKLANIGMRLMGYLIAGIFVFYLAHTYYQASQRNQELQSTYRNKKKTLRKLKTRNRVLAEKRRRLKKDPEAIERILREEYGMLKPNEYRIIE